MSDAQPLANSALGGCAANVGPLIGLDLETSEVTVELSEEVPEGNLAVLPLAVENEDQPICSLTLSSPMDEIVTLARRMLDDEEPDKPRDINDDELDAIGEVLNLMSASIDQSVREHVNAGIRTRPLSWWRTEDPGENTFLDGEIFVAKAVVRIPDGPEVSLTLQVPAKLFERGSGAEQNRRLGRVLLLGIDPSLEETLRPVLASAKVEVEARDPDAEDLDELFPRTETIITTGDRNGAMETCRKLRLGHDSWQIPLIICYLEPTKEKVVMAMECGASHVLGIPADELTILRVLSSARATD